MKKYKVIVVVLAISGLLLAVHLYDNYKLGQMEQYATEHNCKWYYSYYLTEQPVCK